MYRKTSFSTSPSPHVAQGASKEEKTDDIHEIYLASDGNFLNNKHLTPLSGGLVNIFKNYPVRNKVWSMTSIAINRKTGGFALADERGQLYKISIANQVYKTVRTASAPISSICFIPDQKTHLVVAYENGPIVVVDTSSKENIGSVVLKNKTPIEMMKCHPTQSILAAVALDLVYLWDFT